ncbi:hypothetical protein QE152_g31103 [Popillia japonica]|uniref:Uncharacterized protein n=1 Tax=Popillia japonica TaxID=7064 RepID=A0AAW1JCJ4_POPJA
MTKKAVDWDAFNNSIEILRGTSEMSDHVAFTSVIKQAYKSSLNQGETSRRGPYWWTDDIAEGRAKCIAARRELT